MARSLTILTLVLGYAIVIPILIYSAREFHREGLARIRAGEGEGRGRDERD